MSAAQAWLLSFLLLLAACAGAPRAQHSSLAALFSDAQVQAARAAAPDLLARAERARKDADSASAAAARADHELRARWLLQAALVETERIAIERRRSQLQQQIDDAEQARAQDEHARAVAQAQLEVLQASQLAQRQAEAGFAQVQQAAAGRGERAGSSTERAQAVAFLVQRTRLVAAAARALGASGGVAADVDAKLDAAQAAPGGSAQALERALAAFGSAQQALGSARATHAVTAEQLQDLVARASELGVHAQRSTRGVVVGMTAVFAPSSAQPRGLEQPKWSLLRALLLAYPAGQVRVEGRTHAAADKVARRLAQARAVHVHAWLVQGLPASRVVVVPEPSAPAPDDDVVLVLDAYRDAASR